jgi:hypothetical protein
VVVVRLPLALRAQFPLALFGPHHLLWSVVVALPALVELLLVLMVLLVQVLQQLFVQIHLLWFAGESPLAPQAQFQLALFVPHHLQ